MTTFPQVVYDIDQTFGNDLVLSPQNDLNTVSDLTRSEQRIVRRLMTNPGDYVWQPTYGAGLPNFVGVPLSADTSNRIKALITSQIFLEPSVAKTPAPVITLQSIPGGIFCQINYTEEPSRQPTILKFNIT